MELTPISTVELYRSSTLLARTMLPRADQSRVVVTFAPRTTNQNLANEGFAERLLIKAGVPAVHVLCADNSWFQYADIDECLAAIADFIRRYDFRVTYGSSMGAYAALNFSKALGADRAVAISPQISIDRKKVPFERRWRGIAAATTFVRDDMATGLSRTAEVICLYDPRNRDRAHIRRIEALRPLTRMIIPFSGHGSGVFLKQIDLVSTVARRLFEPAPLDATELAAWRQTVRERRRGSQIYWKSLSEVLARREKLEPAIRALQQALQLRPNHGISHERLGNLLLRVGDYTGARYHLLIGIQGRPNQANVVLDLATAEARLGKRRAALQRLDVFLDREANQEMLQLRNRIARRIRLPERVSTGQAALYQLPASEID